MSNFFLGGRGKNYSVQYVAWPKLGASGGMLPRKILKFTTSETCKENNFLTNISFYSWYFFFGGGGGGGGGASQCGSHPS